MPSSIVFTSDEAKAAIRAWFDRFRARLPVPADEAVVDTSFGRTHALIAGPGDAAPLVLLHGALASSAHALAELGPLLRTRRVYALDIIGQSVMSEDRRLDLDGDEYGRWAAEAVTALGVDRYDLYGVSWGGFVARKAVSFAPQRVRHLALMVPAGWVAGHAWAGFRDVGWPILCYRAFPSEARLQRVTAGLFTTPDPMWTAYFGDALRSYRVDIRLPPLATAEDVAPIACPTLVFGAEEDRSFPGRPLMARVKALLPQAETELIEGSKHCPPFTDGFRDRIGARLEQFFGSATSSRSTCS